MTNDVSTVPQAMSDTSAFGKRCPSRPLTMAPASGRNGMSGMSSSTDRSTLPHLSDALRGFARRGDCLGGHLGRVKAPFRHATNEPAVDCEPGVHELARAR